MLDQLQKKPCQVKLWKMVPWGGYIKVRRGFWHSLENNLLINKKQTNWCTTKRRSGIPFPHVVRYVFTFQAHWDLRDYIIRGTFLLLFPPLPATQKPISSPFFTPPSSSTSHSKSMGAHGTDHIVPLVKHMEVGPLGANMTLV